MDSSSKQIKWGIILTYLQMAIGIVINLFYTPIMIKVLGKNEYGIYQLASSVISYLSILSLGFGSSYIRFYSKYKANNDEEGIKKLNGLYFLVFLVLSAIVTVAGCILIPNVQIFFNETYSVADINLAKILMIFLTANLAISFSTSIFNSYITSQEKFIFQKLINILSTVLSPCLCVAALFIGYGSIGLVAISTIIALLVNVLNIIFCISKLKMRFKFDGFDKELFKEIFVFSIFIAMNQIIDQLNWQTDKIILGKMINASAVAVYAVASTLNNMYMMLSTSISSVFVPRVNKIVCEKKENANQELTDLFVKVGRIQFFVIMLIFTGFVFFGKYFLNLWVGHRFLDSEVSLIYYIVILLMASSTIPLIQNVGIEIQRAKNKHQFRSIVYLIVAILNILISIILCNFYGIIGVTIGTLLANIIGCVLIMNIYYHKKIGLNIPFFCKEIGRASLGLILPILFGIIILKYVVIKNILIFSLLIIAYTFVYSVSVYFFGMNKKEQNYIKAIKNRIIKKESTNC